MNLIHNFLRDEDGVTSIEYALVASVMASIVALVFGNLLIGPTAILKAAFTKVKDAIPG